MRSPRITSLEQVRDPAMRHHRDYRAGGALWPALVLLAYATGAVIGQLSFASTGHGEDMPAGTRPRRAAK